MIDFKPKKKKPILPALQIRLGLALMALLLVVVVIYDMSKVTKVIVPTANDKFVNSNVVVPDKVVPRQLPAHKDFQEMPRIYESVFDDYKYPEDVANLSLEAGVYYYMLIKLCTQTDAYWKAQSLRIPTDIRFSDLMQYPDKHRGKIITLKGQIRTLFKQELAPNNPAQIKYNYHGQIMDLDHNLYSFQTLDALDVKVDDMVTMTGIFMKRWCYRNRGNKWQWTPLLFSRQLNKILPPKHKAEDYLQYLVIGVLILAGIFAFILHKSTMNADKDFREFMYANRGRKKLNPKKVSIRKRHSKDKKRIEDEEDTSQSSST